MLSMLMIPAAFYLVGRRELPASRNEKSANGVGDPETNFHKKTPVMEEDMTGVKGERTDDVLISTRRASGFRRSVMPD